MGSFYVSSKLPTYPSTKPTLTLSSYFGKNDGLGEGEGKSFTETKNDPRYVRNREREIDARAVLSGSYYEVAYYHDLSVECGKQAPEYCKGSRKQKKKSGRMRCSSLAKHSIEYGKQ